METALVALAALTTLLGRALFWVAAVVAAIALLDWMVRTRRLNPFGPVARFMRQYVDPLMRPVEARIVRAGGQPSSAPWWTLVFVVVGGILLVALLQFVGGLMRQLAAGLSGPRGLWVLAVSWTFGVLRLALVVRVVSTWFQITPYSRWVRWTYPMTEWMLAPLRRILPLFGPVDVSPLVAFVLLSIIEGVLT
jgi:YggT family protein